MASSDASVSIGQVALVVNDLPRMIDFYTRTLGFDVLTRNGEAATLGAGARPLLELRRDPNARQRPHEAGLFHNAFLLPTRAKLGSWLRHAVDTGVRLDGASDHGVSEALYLQDPEGNGIEVYCDRPRTTWEWAGGNLKLGSRRMDQRDLMNASQGNWKAAPKGTVIGHVHLQVGDVGATDSFMLDTLALDRTVGMPSAGFYSADGYHHHLAGNIWNSQNAGPRSADSTGLAEVELLADPSRLAAGLVVDPWGTQFRITETATAVDGAQNDAVFA